MEDHKTDDISVVDRLAKASGFSKIAGAVYKNVSLFDKLHLIM